MNKLEVFVQELTNAGLTTKQIDAAVEALGRYTTRLFAEAD